MSIDQSELEYFGRIRERLYTAVIHDVLDEMGHRNQALPANIRPLRTTDRVVGRAATMKVLTVENPDELMPFGFSLKFLDGLSEGEVVVGSTDTNASISVWGEIMSTAAQSRGAAGVILNGYGRDAAFIEQMDFPAFFTGLTPTGSVGRIEVREVRVDIEMDGVTVHNGDLVMGDRDGCLVIPRDVEAAVMQTAFEKVDSENKVRAELNNGASIVDMYEEYGVL